MPLITFLFGLILVLVGVVFYSLTETASWTPLIPSLFGAVFLICALASIKRQWRMHAMHAAVLLALLLVVGSIMPLLKPTFEKVAEALLTIALCLAYMVMCVRSFIAARRARKAEAAQADKPAKP
ncbi:MAG: hypothetical protein IT445_08935 [Phycisphaeraceae bacterium]|nr:hypothetical protein [Phycisphaeraceae bacterium]